jgi:hypothetical protein
MDFFRAFCSGAPEEAYQAADEVGIMILQTTTSWIGPRTVGTTKDLLKRFAPRVKNECIEIIERDYNHPCIVGYALSNEAWKGAYIPLFNELYDLSKSICPWRPILTISGVSPHSRGWENLKSDISSLHSYHGWYLGPRQVIADETKKFKNTKQPHILPEKVGAYLSSQHEIWRRWIGDKRHMDLAAREEYLARSIKEIAEHQRMHRDVYAGAMIFSNFERYRHEKYVNPGIKGKAAFNSTVKPTVAKVFSPVLVCADTFADHSNYFAGKEMRFNLYAINDYQKRNIAGAKIRIKLVGNPDNVLFASNEEVGDLPGNSLKKFPIRMSIPPDAVTGFYGLKFSIEEDGKSLNNNSYSVFIMNKKDIPSRIETNKRILLLKSQILAEILDSLSISYDSWKPQRKLNQLDKTEFKEKLKNHDILIISPNTLNWISSLSTGNSIIPEFVAGGGKILCLEQEFNLFKGWLPQNLELNKADITKSTFVDVRNEFHPVFKDLSWKNFDTWNGNKGIIADGILSPLPKEKEVLLATVVPGGACSGGVYPQRAVILNYRYGRGEYLLSQIKALKRYGKDPVATKYLTNILEYVLTQEPYFKARKQYDINIVEDIGDGPFSPDKNGFIRYWLVCGPFPNPGGRLSYHSVTGIGSSGTGLDKDFFASSGGEQNLMPVEGMTQTANFYNTKEGYWMEDVQLPVSRIDCSWNKIKSSNYSVGLNFPYFSTNIIGYAACYIESPEDRKAKVKIGSDDGYKFYLNHKMAGKLNKVRGIKIDDNIHNILLKKGLNTLLIAISQDVGGFGFCLRFTDMNDKPLTDLKIWLAPNK